MMANEEGYLKPAGPHGPAEWHNPNVPLPRKVLEAEAAAVRKSASLIDLALAVLVQTTPKAEDQVSFTGLLPAVIVAQALDRLGEKLIQAASIAARRG